MKRDTKIKIISYVVASFVILAGFTYSGYRQAAAYKMQIEYNYERALDELSDEVGNIDIALQKSLYTGSHKQFDEMATKLWAEAASAKNNVAQLPFTEDKLEGFNKFLSQVGEFAMSLSDKNALDEDITDEEYATLEQLSKYASRLKNEINSMQTEFTQGQLWAGEVERVVQASADVAQDVNITDGFREMEDGLTDYPTLIYDGPFSDHLLERKSLMTENLPELTVEQARKKAAEFLECDENLLENSQDTLGNLPTYGFVHKDNGKAISITKKGGLVASTLSSRQVLERKLTPEEACEKAEQFLKSKGSASLVRSYFETAENICTVNFAVNSNGVTVYTELIKAAVALDNGEILSVDAKNYIINHRERAKYTPKKTEQEARKIVSKHLSIVSSKIAIIPTDGENEILCYEFLCKGKNDEHVLVYVNADNLIEEEILMLLESDDGTLTI